jgi:hypothetical protein
MLYTNAYIERSIKLFVKNDDPNLFIKVDAAFSEFRYKFNKKCEVNLRKEMGLNYVFEGKGGKTPATKVNN